MNRFWKAISLSAGLLLLAGISLNAGCSSSGKTRFRFMNAVANNFTNLDVLVNPTASNTKPVFSNVAYGTVTSYQSVASGSQQVEIESSGTSDSLFTQSVGFNSGADTTVMAANTTAGAITYKVFSDNNSAPATNDFNLRIINASSSGTTGPAADVYVGAPPLDITSVSPTISGLAFGSASNYLAKAAGNWQIVVTPPTQKLPVVDTGSLSFSSGQVRTFVIINSQGGGETYSLLSDLN